jgi:homoserine dehydrogenase
VVPGFTAGHAEHGVVTLGRGGTDLSAVFFAARLGSKRVRLLKDVDGVYAEDPAANPNAERYGALGYDMAAEASKGLIQPKAIDAAKAAGIAIEIAAIGHHEATVIAALPPRKEVPVRFPKLRVALLGCGAVGAGILSCLRQRPDLFEVNPVLVREPAKHRRGEFADQAFTVDLDEALAGKVDLLVETIGGAERPARLMRDALRRGVHVITANKAAVALHYARLHEAAAEGGASLAYTAGVGGGTPILETIGRLRAVGAVVSVEGVMNGTAHFLLDKLSEGWAFDAAVAQAQALGFAEADPATDVDGHDAADKLSILARDAFGAVLLPGGIAKESLRSVTAAQVRAAQARGEVLKQVGRCRLLENNTVFAEVAIESLPATHPLAGARNEENRFLVTDADGHVHAVYGKGAGRWPTTASVFADIMDLQRRLAAAPGETVHMRLTA